MRLILSNNPVIDECDTLSFENSISVILDGVKCE